jgi:Tfp pilus assembly protein PilF
MERIEKLKDFLADNPGDSFIQHALALEYVKLGMDDEARKLFENILRQDPGYVGSYYHLARLLERTGETAAAIQCYEKGMQMARESADQHSYSELRSAYDDLVF